MAMTWVASFALTCLAINEISTHSMGEHPGSEDHPQTFGIPNSPQDSPTRAYPNLPENFPLNPPPSPPPPTTSDEENLLSHLFSSYNPSARPVLDSSATVLVNLKFSLLQIQELNVRNQILTSTGFLILEWRDERLTWTRDVSSLDEVVVKGENIWRPEFAVINGAESIYGEYNEFQAIIRSDGVIRWEPGGIFKTMCGIDITFYPFDTQKCEIKFGAWSYHTTKMNLTTDEMNIRIDAYEKNGEWQVMDTNANRSEFAFKCCPSQRFSFISFAVELRRRHTFYIMNVIVPGLLTSAVLLSLFYCVPSQKVHIGVAALLSFRLFLVNVADAVPRTSDHIPLLGIYLTCTMAITTLAMVATVLVGNLYETKDRPVPKWLKTLMMDHLARVLCMNRGSAALEGIATNRTATNQRERSMSWSWCCLVAKNKKKQEADDEHSSEYLREDEELQMMATYNPRSRRTDVKTHRTSTNKGEKKRLKDSPEVRTSHISRSKSFDLGAALASIALSHVNERVLFQEKSNEAPVGSTPTQIRNEDRYDDATCQPKTSMATDVANARHPNENNEIDGHDESSGTCNNHLTDRDRKEDEEMNKDTLESAIDTPPGAQRIRLRRGSKITNGLKVDGDRETSTKRSVESKKFDEHRPLNYSKDWAHLAAVCDRFFFWLCLFFILGTTMLLFHPLTTSRFFKIPVIDKI